MSLTIKTPVVESGELTLNANSAIGDLMAVGVIFHTTRMDQERFIPIMQTDEAGLEILAGIAESAGYSISAAVQALGELVVHSEKHELSESTLTSLGWLMVTLGELGNQVQGAQRVAADNLTLRKQQARTVAPTPSL